MLEKNNKGYHVTGFVRVSVAELTGKAILQKNKIKKMIEMSWPKDSIVDFQLTDFNLEKIDSICEEV